MASSGWRSVFESVMSAVRTATQSSGSSATRRSGSSADRPGSVPAGQRSSDYPGDFKGMPPISYAPHADNQFDPGEIVWAWVPFEEDYSQGKDRPVLLIGTDGPWLLALPLTSKDHDRDAAQERRAGRLWVDIGSGPWDTSGRRSEVRVNRTLRIDPARVRRQACALTQDRFEQVEQAVRAAYRS
ncbi:type II toxin-antitoxin system PemK/MazF family toxin [Branchiibius sp. NY16-3462-2]|uniref:type II toxin-antitoxin system PemK/MazF family toxin n=1 Tax=Branchiibius sp. NY16-3462-2 TaxID=1807500 RepID=UPI000798B674|nr:type II toxin-antitoxin system PemK/MazF family toxin [Branchiibius sp. NY16-3462-2]KYH43780.1 growth inhibitor PemK [Branchiibius sp. NY16-3462-2]